MPYLSIFVNIIFRIFKCSTFIFVVFNRSNCLFCLFCYKNKNNFTKMCKFLQQKKIFGTRLRFVHGFNGEILMVFSAPLFSVQRMAIVFLCGNAFAPCAAQRYIRLAGSLSRPARQVPAVRKVPRQEAIAILLYSTTWHLPRDTPPLYPLPNSRHKLQSLHYQIWSNRIFLLSYLPRSSQRTMASSLWRELFRKDCRRKQ